MEGIQELCWKCVAIFIFCMAFTIGFSQLCKAHIFMERWKDASQIEQDIRRDEGE